MKKVIVLFLAFVLIIFIFNLNKKQGNILYSWSMDVINDSELMDIIKNHNISTIYQDFSSNYLEENDNYFVENMIKKNVEVYHLCGEPYWGFESSPVGMKKEIDKVVIYNNNVDYDIKGIVFDVEPYLEKKNFDFSLYVKNMKEAYNYAKKNGLIVVIAIPVWFETIDESLLDELIKNACDEVSLMNYSIDYTKKNMKTEVFLAKKYNKKINTIYEINFGDEDYFSSYKEIEKDFNKIKNEYSYFYLRKAYHHYGKMKQFYK